MATVADSSVLFYATVAIILFAGSLGYSFTRLYHARMLFVERQTRGLVSYQIPLQLHRAHTL